MSETRTALITGAGRRIGLWLTEQLLEQGFAVYAHYHSSDRELCRLRERHAALNLIRADLLTEAGLAVLRDTIPAESRLDLLLNNASRFYRREPEQLTRDDYLDFYTLHVAVPALLTRSLLPQLQRARPGVVVNMLDARAARFRGGYLPYGLSRLAASELTQRQAREFKEQPRVYGLALNRLLPEAGAGDDPVQVEITDDAARQLASLREALTKLLTGDPPTGTIIPIGP